jgi:3',5'-cyclic AMP phosphodiesterase CpdA
MARIVVLSDIHLSPTHRFFWDVANTANADALIVNGDLAINGPTAMPRSPSLGPQASARASHALTRQSRCRR